MGHGEQDKREEQREARKRRQRQAEGMHPAGPHARPELTDDDATPGTGALPDRGKGGDVDPGSE
jgi:hypothetical protein